MKPRQSLSGRQESISSSKQTDLAEIYGNQIKLSARTMNAGELRDIAKYLGTTVDKLTCPNAIRGDAISRIMRKIHTDSAREALGVADKLSDMILFHKTVRENGTEMMKTLEGCLVLIETVAYLR